MGFITAEIHDETKGGTPDMKDLEPQKQFWIKQVAATMAIEDMPVDSQTYGYLRQIAAGEKTVEQAIREIKKECANG